MAQILGGNGRYAKSRILTFSDKKNDDISYISRRFIPDQDTQDIVGAQEVQPGDRPDLVAYRAYGNPLLYYLVADCNLTLNPFALTQKVGRLLIVPRNTT